jgi:hypothetical protein
VVLRIVVALAKNLIPALLPHVRNLLVWMAKLRFVVAWLTVVAAVSLIHVHLCAALLGTQYALWMTLEWRLVVETLAQLTLAPTTLKATPNVSQLSVSSRLVNSTDVNHRAFTSNASQRSVLKTKLSYSTLQNNAVVARVWQIVV